ncbi:MAG: hypothetical protein IH991_04630 [Planctomycetes bacterium]|nr:hypothetical protein [Planctomycetota bacterium]
MLHHRFRIIAVAVFACWASLELADAGQINLPAAFAITNPDPKHDGFQFKGHTENLHTVLDLLRNGCEVHWIAAVPADVVEKQIVRRGDYIVPMNQAKALLALVVLQSASERLIELQGPIRYQTYSLRHPKLLVDAQLWAGNYYWYYDTLLRGGFAFEHLLRHDNDSFDAKRHNLFVVPGGGGRIPSLYNDMLRSYVKEGGNYLGSCWGCAQALYPSKVSYGSGNGAGIADAHNNEVIRSFGALGGVGHITLKNDAPDHPIMWDQPDEIHNIYWNGPVMRPGKFSKPLATLKSVVANDFRFHSREAKQRRQDVLEDLGKCLYLTSQRPNEGKVTVFGNHPEASDGVNPFRAHPMGYKAVYNAILFSTAGRKGELELKELGAKRIAILDGKTNEGFESLAELAICKAVRAKANRLRILVAEKLKQGGRRWTEDQHAGFYLMRLDSALANIGNCSLRRFSGEQPEAARLRDRIRIWSNQVVADLDQLQRRLRDIDGEKMIRRKSTTWHAVVCPTFERSNELSHLQRDVRYFFHSTAASFAKSP